MKINKQDEYGLRLLLRIAKTEDAEGLSIPVLAEQEGLSQPYVAKLTRDLRIGGLIQSTRGQKGGYILAKSPSSITIKEVISILGGELFEKDFCGSHAGTARLCTNSVDCSVRSLWRVVQHSVDKVLAEIKLEDLMYSEKETKR
ncbi:MAG TPA: Rrf2 family transcriptional regulator, partial [Saprospiraceae bacterium]|nr:Rrf2 family transcriptional regulator [Saprospiraceae bacterium]